MTIGLQDWTFPKDKKKSTVGIGKLGTNRVLTCHWLINKSKPLRIDQSKGARNNMLILHEDYVDETYIFLYHFDTSDAHHPSELKVGYAPNSGSHYLHLLF